MNLTAQQIETTSNANVEACSDEPRVILLVDDNVLVRRLFANFLEELGYVPLSVDRPEDVPDLILEYRPALVLLDIVMPNVSGIDVLDAIRSDVRIARTPVAAVTTLTAEPDARQFLDAGFDAYVAKPVNLADFARTVRRLTEAA